MFKSSFIVKDDELKAKKSGIHGKIKSKDGIDLGFKGYISKHPKGCILFYHGGGANNLNYTGMAENLCDNSNIATFLFDIRGHGQSQGLREFAPSKEVVWADINNAVQFIRKQYPDIPIYLVGHSSGAGLILNYSSWNKKEYVDNYIMVAPELGYRVAKQKKPFAKVNYFYFIINKLTGGYLFNKSLAVHFNYSEEQINTFGYLRGYTGSMAEAVTPNDPLNALINLKKPLYIFIAKEDELIDNTKLKNLLASAIQKNSLITVESIPSAKHIMILKDIYLYIGKLIYPNENN